MRQVSGVEMRENVGRASKNNTAMVEPNAASGWLRTTGDACRNNVWSLGMPIVYAIWVAYSHA